MRTYYLQIVFFNSLSIRMAFLPFYFFTLLPLNAFFTFKRPFFADKCKNKIIKFTLCFSSKQKIITIHKAIHNAIEYFKKKNNFIISLQRDARCRAIGCRLRCV